jgi:Rrf2 family nitric oxide-sensitive transcriptional repressor
MRLTTYTDYSLRVLIYLAVNTAERPTIREIAERYGISRNHLMKVVQELSKRGYIAALRGKNGGLQLNQAPAEIKIGRLVRAMENEMALAECFGSNNRCILTPACALQSMLTEALNSFIATLDCYTLEDVISGQQKPELLTLLDAHQHVTLANT